MFYAKDIDGNFLYNNSGRILLTDSSDTMIAILQNRGSDNEGTTIHEFDVEDLLVIRDRVDGLRVYLSLPKFQGIGNDYVNVADIRHRLGF